MAFNKIIQDSLRLPKIFSIGSFNELREVGGYYLDKTHFISKIEDLNVRSIISLSPRRFGKTLFCSTLASYYNIKNKEKFKQLFSNLYIEKNPTPLATSFLIFNFTFYLLPTSKTDIFNYEFHSFLNSEIFMFMHRYKQELGNYYFRINEKTNALTNFLKLLKAVQSSGHKIYVFIDEYDANIKEALRYKTVSKIKLIESSFKQFYSCLKTACDKDIAYVFQTGVTSVDIAEFTTGFNISTDLILKEKFWNLYGFKKSEIESLLDNVFGNNFPSNIKEGIIKWLYENNEGYFFSPNQPEGIFNSSRILYYIHELIGKIEDIDYSNDTSTIIRKLTRFPPDPNTLPPSDKYLELLKNNKVET
ncbi:hypothetical protein Glove_302g33 [Diversispora epigaea]|uniref:AAA-ATPase-like domain-containing protein n=1 Tax=Diversispora epigaea TaxID=1348612 RepID=A0A397HWP6_9GLOM|nr:hypothetical protein Glove_302g33 [Diversispora epigaea]